MTEDRMPRVLIADDLSSRAAETFAACAACHSERLVAQQGMTREQWDELDRKAQACLS